MFYVSCRRGQGLLHDWESGVSHVMSFIVFLWSWWKHSVYDTGLILCRPRREWLTTVMQRTARQPKNFDMLVTSVWTNGLGNGSFLRGDSPARFSISNPDSRLIPIFLLPHHRTISHRQGLFYSGQHQTSVPMHPTTISPARPALPPNDAFRAECQGPALGTSESQSRYALIIDSRRRSRTCTSSRTPCGTNSDCF